MISPPDNHTPAPEFSAALARDVARLLRYESRFESHVRAHPVRRLGMVVVVITGAVMTLAIGLVWGTNTGYASARVEGQRQRDEMAAATTEVKGQLAALRVGLARVRSDLARRARNDAQTAASLTFAEAELRSMEASAERIDLDLTNHRLSAAALPPAQVTGLSVTRALATTCNVLAQAAAPPRQGIPVVDLPAAAVKTTETFGGILGVRQSSDGNVLVNDAARRQIKLLDTTLSASTVVVDSTPGTSTSYGQYASPLIPYLGDSSLFADHSTRGFTVLDGRGRIVRSLALPKPGDFIAINSSPSGIDAEGRLIFRQSRPPTPDSRRAPFPRQSMNLADSIPILRADFDFRRIDTIGRVSRPLMKLITEPFSDGTTAYVFALDPLQPIDEWAVLSTGAVAFVRGHDYHIDWVQPGGTTMATTKLPFDWKRLTDEDKRRLTDSVRAAQNAQLAAGYTQAEYGIRVPCSQDMIAAIRSGASGGSGRSGGSGGLPPGVENACVQVIQAGTIQSAGALPLRQMAPLPSLADLLRANPIADYLPPIAASSTIADRDGNLWILPRTSPLSKNGELVYDVVNSDGKLFERVRLPVGRAIAGFAKGGVVYLTSGDRTNGFRLERTRLAPRATASLK
jgi:hypothetical protein